MNYRDIVRSISGPQIPAAITTLRRFLTTADLETDAALAEPGLVQAADGTVSIVDADGNQSPLGWTSERNVGQCSLEFNGFGVGQGETEFAPFSYLSGDASMVDLAAPTTPKPVAAGIYAYTLVMHQQGGGGAGGYTPIFGIDNDWYALSLTYGPVNATTPVLMSATWYSDALSPFRLAVSGEASDLYDGILYLQRLG